MRDKLVFAVVDGKRVFASNPARNKELSNKVASTLTYGMLGGKTDAELIAEIWDDESLSNEEVATLIYAFHSAIEKLNSVSEKVGLGKQVKAKQTINLEGGDVK